MSKMKSIKEELVEIRQQLQDLTDLVKGNVPPVINIAPSNVVEKYIPANTFDLQRNELDIFMMALDSYWSDSCYESFVYPHLLKVSFTTAVKLYNVENWVQDGMYYYPDGMPQFRFPANRLRAAFFGKGFKKVKLQWDKRKHEWINGGDKLSPQYPEYYDLLLLPLIKAEAKKKHVMQNLT